MDLTSLVCLEYFFERRYYKIYVSGVWNEYMKERKLIPQNRYIQGFHSFGENSHVIITLYPPLVKYIMTAQWIMVDTTFKVVYGGTNEFKILIWDTTMQRCELKLFFESFSCSLVMISLGIVVGRVWTNSATRNAFFHIWNGLWDAIKNVSERELNFRTFSPGSSLLGVVGDAEGAQAQGFGDMVLHRNLNERFDSKIQDSDTVLMHLWKTCTVHFDRWVPISLTRFVIILI